MKKRIVSMLLAVLLLALCAMPALAAAPKVKKVEYEGNGVVDVDFTTKNVRYRNAKVTVKDAAGKKLTIRKIEKDTDGLDIDIHGMVKGKKYTVTVSGVRVKGVGSYTKVTKTFTA